MRDPISIIAVPANILAPNGAVLEHKQAHYWHDYLKSVTDWHDF